MRLMKTIIGSTAFVLALIALPARSADQAGVSAAVQGRVELTREEGRVVGRQVLGKPQIRGKDLIYRFPG